eukprot:CAMPEP_0195284156 /NCGR_PEP_ID=MMETSP0707-20130614/2458_1 /TAXON_ID=33640 /ORGANISM="Asterionellopsis glacialis, Strain CCMP134" /LENGTH=468 /DNA_ID=CAMNT_0040343461 /DNA_START=12 /DNA_END=1418 /DNA_ORIENTATION=+
MESSSIRKQDERTEQQTRQEEENLAARRAGVEALDIGRETLMVAAAQNEQIVQADRHADDAQYAVDKSGRVLRGMTWSGWVANMFTKDIDRPSSTTTPPCTSSPTTKGTNPTRSSATTTLKSLEFLANVKPDDIPEEMRSAVQAVQNFRCHLLILEKCETNEQQLTCFTVCDTIYQVAVQEISKLHISHDHSPHQNLFHQLSEDLTTLREIQNNSLAAQTREKNQRSTPRRNQDSTTNNGTTIITTTTKHDVYTKPKSALEVQQDEHLESLSQNLGELNSIAKSMGQMMTDQNELLETVNEKSESILEKSKLVTRKAHKLIQRKAWSPAKKEFQAYVCIQHVESGNYVAVSKNGSLGLVDRFHPDACTFGMWQRQGSIFGLKHRYTTYWLGQTLLGYLSCSGSSFGNREEWDSSGDWERVQLLCACANWGVGGYMVWQKGTNTLALSGSGPEDKKAADIWCLKELEES